MRGLRPRKFFPQVKELKEKKTMTKDKRQFNPDWNKEKRLKRA